MGWKTCVVLAVAAYIAYKSVDKFDPDSLKGKRVVITGASSGIGEQTAYHYARFGARILITARRVKLLKQVVARCKELGAADVSYIPLDMSKHEDSKVLIDEAKKRLGGLDHLILNHIINNDPGFWKGDYDYVLNKTMEINFHAYVRIATYALPMLSKSAGSIGVVSSVAGKVGIPFVAVYSASKFALHGFFDSLRQELHIQNINVSISTFVLGGINTTSATEEWSVFERSGFAASPSATALRIVTGTSNREREVHYPRSVAVSSLLRDVAPSFVEWMFSFSLNQDHVKTLLKNTT
ncbi:11-beta-hydroxysteroid dehydrogenase 1-like [Asterias amurensis]|uniref:11-beta-hydroxysteroid dehydrogenase 1-like n=1 Tax=Asterias amurensis TaxID=7602 RepID=UPI003AB7EF64